MVTGVVLLGGIGGEGLAGTRLAPPLAWVSSPANGSAIYNTSNLKATKLYLTFVSCRAGRYANIFHVKKGCNDALTPSIMENPGFALSMSTHRTVYVHLKLWQVPLPGVQKMKLHPK